MAEASRIRRNLLDVLVALAFIALAAFATSAPAAAADHNYAAMVVDAKTGEVLFSRNADAPRFPASLTKVMTLYLVFEDLERGRISLNTRLTVSQNAANQAPTKLGVPAGSTIKVEDAILALVTKSANDVAMVIAENLGGSQSGFAQRMNATARALGMNHTTFRNPHGLPDSAQVTTARDLITLGRAIQDRFPQYFRYFSTEVFVWNGVRMGNHNNLLGAVPGVNGIKTGYTRASGYNLLTSVSRDNRQIVAVVMGGNTAASRDEHMRQLIAEYLPRASTGPRTVPLLVANAAPSLPAPVPRPNPIALGMAPAAADPIVTATVQVATADPLPLEPIPPAAIAPAAIPPAAVAMAALALEEEPEIPSEGDADNSWKIQIGAPPTEDGAHALLNRARSAQPGALGTAAPYVETFTNDRGNTFYRARFSGFPTQEAARAACAQLERSNFDCYVPAQQ
ncbi:MAG: D-alanyl-D-alanine carboxypeptidase [Bauldia sp.]|nr:D-alanyl-D-alanine carboxypeptidase [Bauldia sp.]